jgi:hypothetical protein
VLLEEQYLLPQLEVESVLLATTQVPLVAMVVREVVAVNRVGDLKLQVLLVELV